MFLSLVAASLVIASVPVSLRYAAQLGPQTMYWQGGASDDWGDWQNWYPRKVPFENSDVVIESKVRLPRLTKSVKIHNLTMQQSASLRLDGNGLQVQGAMVNSGTLVLRCGEQMTAQAWQRPGTIELNGSSGGTSCVVPSAYPYDTLVLKGTDDTTVFSLSQDLAAGRIELWKGTLDLAGHDLQTGVLVNQGVILMTGAEHVDFTTFVLWGQGKFRIVGNGDGKASTIVMRSRKLTNLVIDTKDPGDIVTMREGASIDGATWVNQGTLYVQQSASLTTDILSVEGGNVRVGGALIVRGPAAISKGGVYTTLGRGAQVFKTLTINGGTLNALNSSGVFSVSGNLELLSGTFKAPASVTLGGNFKKSGGVFDPGRSTFTLNGKNQVIDGSLTFQNLSKVAAAADTLTFQANATVIVKGTLMIRGSSRGPFLLRSSVSGSPWFLDARGQRILDNFRVSDSKGANKRALVCTPGCVDGGNNKNWILSK
jgi:hypothetical protein